MIKGKTVSLRPVRDGDLELLYAKNIDIESRGPWYPLPQNSLTKMRKSFAETGYWTPELGQFLVVDGDDRLVGWVAWWKLTGSVADIEIGYRTFDPADRGKGFAREAVDLLGGWLFDSQPINRLQLVIHVDNGPSHRVAEKTGYTHEATAREAWYHKGSWHDVDVFTMTRSEFDRRRRTAVASTGA